MQYTTGMYPGLKNKSVDWIQGNKFMEMADFCFTPTKRANDDYNKLKNTMVEPEGIIYTHTMYVHELFDIIKKSGNEVVVITHSSDERADIIPPTNVRRWYAQNVDITHPRVESIPIGIESIWWHPKRKKREKMIQRLSKERVLVNTLYINHYVRRNPPEREAIYKMFEDKPWVTAKRGRNGQNFNEYINDIYSHMFVACPEGNGIDTHRLWECLYLGTIPILKRNINNQFYTDLPICFIDSWEEVTKDFLEKEYKRIKSETWNMEKLNFAYWKNKIRK